MNTLGDAMKEAGFKESNKTATGKKVNFKLSISDTEKVKKSLKTLKKKFRRATCRDCDDDIKFVKIDGNMIPHSVDGEVHWRSCPYSSYSQRKTSINIMKKLSVLFIVKLGINLESEAGLSSHEAKVVYAVLEKAFRGPVVEVGEKPGKVIDTNTEETIKEDLKAVEDVVKPIKSSEVTHGDDPIGDPDEDLAPSEAAIEAEAQETTVIVK